MTVAGKSQLLPPQTGLLAIGVVQGNGKFAQIRFTNTEQQPGKIEIALLVTCQRTAGKLPLPLLRLSQMQFQLLCPQFNNVNALMQNQA